MGDLGGTGHGAASMEQQQSESGYAGGAEAKLGPDGKPERIRKWRRCMLPWLAGVLFVGIAIAHVLENRRE